MFLLLLFLAVAPVALILGVVFKLDRHGEPAKVVALTVLFGALATIPIVIAEAVLSWGFGLPLDLNLTSYSSAAVTAFLVAAVIEECGKFAILWWDCAKHSAFDEAMDGVVYGVAVSLGFALVENVMYVFGSEDSLSVCVARALTAVPLHAACGVIMGACVGIAKFNPAQRSMWIALGIGGAIAVHGIYDFGLFGGLFALTQEHFVRLLLLWSTTLAALAAGILIAIFALARLRRDQEFAMLVANAREDCEPPVADSGTGETDGLPAVEDNELMSAISPRPQGRAPRLPLAAAIVQAVGCLFMFALIIWMVAVAAAEEAGASSEYLQANVRIMVLAVILLDFGTVVLAIVALIMEPRWRIGSVSILVTSTLFGLALVALMIAGAAMESMPEGATEVVP